MDYVDTKFIRALGTRFQKFKEKSSSLFNFRCPLCGDSKTHKNKARAYIYLNKKDNSFHFKCHKCGQGMMFPTFLQEIDSELYQEYRFEKFKFPKKSVVELQDLNVPIKRYDLSILSPLYSISSLDDSISCRNYVAQRKIPKRFWDQLFFCPKFKAYVNTLLPGKMDLKYDEERLVIPFFDENRKVIGMAGRSFSIDSKLRYINIVLDETKPKLFGLDRWNKKKETFVVEGPIDSFFLTNSIATLGGDLASAVQGQDKDKFIIVYDNEPHSPTTRKKIMKCIDEGFRVTIWPKSIKAKDINKMVLEGMNPLDIEEIIRQNTFSGLKAKMELAFR